MVSLSFIGELFALPLTTLALLIAFRKQIYDDIWEYCDNLDEFVTAEVESADSVTPSDVHNWSSTLRSADWYRKGCSAAMYSGYGCFASWILSLGVSRINPFGIGTWSPPLVPATTASMSITFSLGLFSILAFLMVSLTYIDHTRGEQTVEAVTSTDQSSKSDD